MGHLARALNAGPVSMLELTSMLLDGCDPRNLDPLRSASLADNDAVGPFDREYVLGPFLAVRRRETSGLLAVAAEFIDDPSMKARIRSELNTRAFALPRWLRHLAAPTVERCVEMTHVLKDGDNVMLGARLPTGEPISAVVYIDHNVGTLVKDAYVVDKPIDDLVGFMRQKADDPDVAFNELDPADARARIELAIDVAARTLPPFTTDTWPSSRPLVEWMIRTLPTGGRGYEQAAWSDKQRQALAARFFASPYAAELSSGARDIFDLLLWFGCDYGPGDPMRWSNVAVELFLSDFLPRKYAGPAGDLDEMPILLRAFVRFCHAERGLRPELTAEVLTAVDEFEGEFRRLVRASSPGMADWLHEHVNPHAAFDFEIDSGLAISEVMWQVLTRAAGGEHALEMLDDRPLPEEPFDWSGIPSDIREVVGQVLQLCDECCEAFFGTELRTACRRVLARVAGGNPDVFRRKGRADTAAAAICWMTAKANDLFSYHGTTAKELGEWFGVGSNPGARAQTFLKAGGWPSPGYGGVDLGSPAYLTGPRRQHLIELRERYRS
jgi:hypothetical protein